MQPLLRKGKMSYFEKHKKGIIGTIVYHIVLLVILILFGFFTPLPLPGEEGILVNFGTSEQGFGEIEPGPRQNQPAPAQSQPIQQEEESIPAPQTPTQTTPPQVSKPEPAKETAMTQDYEQTAAIDAAEKKKRQEEKKRQDLLEEQRLAQVREAERIKNTEAERVRKAEAEKKAKEEADRKAKEEQQRKINEINSRAAGAFAKGGAGTGGDGSGTGKSQGVTFPGGNQGAPTGDPNASNYGPGGSGSGNQGTGVSFSLAGRSGKSLPKPSYTENDEGKIVVRITVDKDGNVTSAEPGVQGTTISNARLQNEARSAALKAKFNKDENAPAFQQGTITYQFVFY